MFFFLIKNEIKTMYPGKDLDRLVIVMGLFEAIIKKRQDVNRKEVASKMIEINAMQQTIELFVKDYEKQYRKRRVT